MTETPDLTLRQWFGKLIRGQHHLAIGGEDDPYLLRWYLIPRNKRLNIYLHQFIPHTAWGAAGCGEPFTGTFHARNGLWNRGAR